MYGELERHSINLRLEGEIKMKEFRKIMYVVLFVVMLFLLVSCSNIYTQTSSIASIEEMNLLRSRDTRTVASAKDPLIASPAGSAASALPDLLVKSVGIFLLCLVQLRVAAVLALLL